jgi:hypothetical protein
MSNQTLNSVEVHTQLGHPVDVVLSSPRSVWWAFQGFPAMCENTGVTYCKVSLPTLKFSILTVPYFLPVDFCHHYFSVQTWKPTFSFPGQSVLDRCIHDHATVSHLKPSLICRLLAHQHSWKFLSIKYPFHSCANCV